MKVCISPIRTEQDYKQALERIDELFEATPGSIEFDELEILATLVSAYEEQHYAIPEPDPIAYIKLKMAENGLKQKDLAKYLGGSSRVSEVLNGKRKLTVKMMRALHESLGIPAESLLAIA